LRGRANKHRKPEALGEFFYLEGMLSSGIYAPQMGLFWSFVSHDTYHKKNMQKKKILPVLYTG
jgi:hypothetical protein